MTQNRRPTFNLGLVPACNQISRVKLFFSPLVPDFFFLMLSGSCSKFVYCPNQGRRPQRGLKPHSCDMILHKDGDAEWRRRTSLFSGWGQNLMDCDGLFLVQSTSETLWKAFLLYLRFPRTRTIQWNQIIKCIVCVCVCELYTLYGVGEDVGDLLPVCQVVQRMPPAGEHVHVGGAAVIDMRPGRHGNVFWKRTNTYKTF